MRKERCVEGSVAGWCSTLTAETVRGIGQGLCVWTVTQLCNHSHKLALSARRRLLVEFSDDGRCQIQQAALRACSTMMTSVATGA